MAALRFGAVELLPEQRRLLVGGRAAALAPRAFDLLLALAERAGGVVPKNELLDLVWHDLVVEENNLQVQISALRKLLGPGAIATIPGRGYQFTLAQSPANQDPQETHTTSADDGAPVLYGRAGDVAALDEQVRRHALVTVVGPAGIGKTRLALAVAEGLQGEFGAGARVAELAPLGDPALVWVTVARALGLGVADTPESQATGLQALARQRLLLVVDNCEHLLDAVGEAVATLRRHAATVHILATSQELLRHPDEHVYRLGPLALPDANTVAGAQTAGAVALFVARAQAVDRQFALDETNVAAVLKICRRLDGIALAIELAAARVALLGVHGVRDRLDERFRLLTGGARVMLPRHRTLQAALEWSYSLLSEAQRTLLDRLGVFAGTFSMACAQQLAADAQTDEWEVLDHLGALVDKSLVAVENGVAGPRYRLLETTRAFALERLAARGETGALLRRHAEVMLLLFEGYHRELREGAQSAKIMPKLVPDLGNLRVALDWAGAADGDRRLAIALFGAALAGHGHFFFATLKARQWIEALAPLVDASIDPAAAARFWQASAEWCLSHQTPAVAGHAERAIALYGALGDRLGECWAWTAATGGATNEGRYDDARRALAEVLRLRDPSLTPWQYALIDNIAAIFFLCVGELDDARRHALAYVDASRRVGSGVNVCSALAILIEVHLAAGEVREAVEIADDLLSSYPEFRHGTEEGRGLRVVACALMHAGRLDEAERVYREAFARLRRNYGTAGLMLYDQALFAALRGRVDDAARLLGYADAAYAAQTLKPRFFARQMRERAPRSIAGKHSAEDLSRLYDQGRRLDDESAFALAMPGGSG